MMHRNLDRRVEVLVRLPHQAAIDQTTALLDLAFDEHTAAWELAADGTWTRTSADDEHMVDLQERLIVQHTRRRAK
jgi:polyphosphate kinase